MTQHQLVLYVDPEEYRCRLLGIPYIPAYNLEEELSVNSSASPLSPPSSFSSSATDLSSCPSWYSNTDLSKMGLNSSSWRRQDHYAVLGLETLRHLATSEQIKYAYRRRILVYHPDKKKRTVGLDGVVMLSEETSPFTSDSLLDPNDENELFKCVQRAWEVLTDPVRRQQFDSVDPAFDSSIPALPAGSNSIITPIQFFQEYDPVFKRNARFSMKQPMPMLGDMHTPRAEVESFYEAWRRFESWRRFELLDSDDETAHVVHEQDADTVSRADRRWADRVNRASRAKRKAEDNTRIARLVEQAYRLDPRIAVWRVQDKQLKEEKQREARVREESQKKALEEAREVERLRNEAEQAHAKQVAAATKAAKEEQRQALRKARKAFRDYWTRVKYHVTDPIVELKLMQERATRVEQLTQALSAMQLETLSQRLAEMTSVQAIEVLFADAKVMGEPVVDKKTENDEIATKTFTILDAAAIQVKASEEAIETPQNQESKPGSVTWTVEMLDTLIKAVKQHPPGTLERWSKVTSAMHKLCPNLTQDQVITEAEQLAHQRQKPSSMQIAQPSNSNTKFDPRIGAGNQPSIRVDATTSTAKKTLSSIPSRPWNNDEQHALEVALKKFSPEIANRWDAIAQELGTDRTPKECQERVREIALALKARRRGT